MQNSVNLKAANTKSASKNTKQNGGWTDSQDRQTVRQDRYTEGLLTRWILRQPERSQRQWIQKHAGHDDLKDLQDGFTLEYHRVMQLRKGIYATRILFRDTLSGRTKDLPTRVCHERVPGMGLRKANWYWIERKVVALIFSIMYDQRFARQ